MSVLYELNLLPMITVRRLEGASYKKIARELRALYPGVRGLSARSVKRICRSYNVHATSRLSDQALDTLVACGIGMVRSIVHSPKIVIMFHRHVVVLAC